MRIVPSFCMLCALAVILTGLALAAEQPTIRVEAHQEISCIDCHDTENPTDIPTNKKCLSCHGPIDDLVKKTEKYNLNPHNSPHWGTQVPCGACHRQHSEPIVYCAPCHVRENFVIR